MKNLTKTQKICLCLFSASAISFCLGFAGYLLRENLIPILLRLARFFVCTSPFATILCFCIKFCFGVTTFFYTTGGVREFFFLF